MEAPYIAQDPQEVAALCRQLESHNGKKKGGFSCKKTVFSVDGSQDGLQVESWRFQEWDYKRGDLPTYARGLFTTRSTRRGGAKEIAVRGYDKFFNVNEVSETSWDHIRTRTQGPYELTLKENGCIIFVSGLEDETLLVCSKHSTGDRADVQVSHASAGERWIEKQLAALGRTKQDLARELRRRNVTAVAELCDDEFEEHILAYTPEVAGLYLHGINLNLGEFATYPSGLVQSFADEWGFKKVQLLIKEDVEDVKTFLENVAETGAHDGRDVEGFVIRCRMSKDPNSRPYRDWFFKYKFEEPYLMYRQWRECTKALIAGRQPKFKKHTKITEEYLLYARKRLAADPKLAKLYNQNHGIISLRDDFLASKHISGADAAAFELEVGDGSNSVDAERKLVTQDVVLVPIATIGCGKTTVAVGLVRLFDWGHIQNDNISGKGRPARMVKLVLEELEAGKPVVISDRNNAERREREQIIKDVKLVHVGARLVALNYVHSPERLEEIRAVTRDRVLARGDNHQTIQAASDRNKFLGIMDGFVDRFQPCAPYAFPDDGFDAVIDLDPVAGSAANLETVVTKLHALYPRLIREMPTREEMDEAVRWALEDYAPDLRHVIPDRGGPGPRQKDKMNKRGGGAKAAMPGQASFKKKPLEYVGVDVPTRAILAVLDAAFGPKKGGSDPATARFYRQLQQTRRVQPRFHVTLMHRASKNEHPELWARYAALHERAEAEGWKDNLKLGECKVVLERAVWDDRIMAIVARLDEEGCEVGGGEQPVEDVDGKDNGEGPAGSPTAKHWVCVNRVPHITVGTRDDSVKPKESNELLGRWLGEGLGEGMGEVVFDGKPELMGDVRGVLSR